jgi:TRAP-type mannitol/chloroaromatic compound transport system permease small subunit
MLNSIIRAIILISAALLYLPAAARQLTDVIAVVQGALQQAEK